MLNKQIAILTLSLCGFSTNVFAEEVIKFAVRSNDMAPINTCHQSSNDLYPKCTTCLTGTSTSSGFLNYSILAHALNRGGLNIPLVPFESPNSERSRRYVSAGTATIRGDWDFNIDGNTAVLKSDPFILPGRMEKGIYGLASNAHLRGLKSTSEVQKLSSVMNPNWRLDWSILNTMGLRKLVKASTKSQMFTLVAHRGIDFTLVEFSDLPDLAQIHDGIRLVPAPGVKVSLPNSQHFMISKKHPQAEQILVAVNRGLTQLHKLGFIENCLAESGIVNRRVDDWTVLNLSTKPLPAANND